MTTENRTMAWPPRRTTPQRRTPPPVCRCGQDLDFCSGPTYCPRCGSSLAARAA